MRGDLSPQLLPYNTKEEMIARKIVKQGTGLRFIGAELLIDKAIEKKRERDK